MKASKQFSIVLAAAVLALGVAALALITSIRIYGLQYLYDPQCLSS